jgi:hypothetical protein
VAESGDKAAKRRFFLKVQVRSRRIIWTDHRGSGGCAGPDLPDRHAFGPIEFCRVLPEGYSRAWAKVL